MGINRAERSLGLIDGVYGVSVTLVALDLPKIVLPLIRSGNFLSIEAISYVIMYVFQFIIMYDMWMIHKNISMKNESAFSKKTEFISMVVMGLVILSPGLVGDMFDVFKKDLDLQSQELNLSKLCIYFYVFSIYGFLFWMDVSKGNKRLLSSFSINGLLSRSLFFLFLFLISLVSFNFGWVLPVPLAIMVMVLTKTFLSHPEYERDDSN